MVSARSAQLEAEFGRGYGEKNLRRMIRFAEVFPDAEIVASLMRQLTWTHFIDSDSATNLANMVKTSRKLEDASIVGGRGDS